MEKYAEATVALGDVSTVTVSTLALESKDTLQKRKKRNDSRVDKDKRRSTRSASRSKGRTKKEKNENIIVERVDDSEKSPDKIHQENKNVYENIEVKDIEDFSSHNDGGEKEEKSKEIDKELKKDKITKMKMEDIFLSQQYDAEEEKPCEGDICDPKICCRDKIGRSKEKKEMIIIYIYIESGRKGL